MGSFFGFDCPEMTVPPAPVPGPTIYSLSLLDGPPLGTPYTWNHTGSVLRCLVDAKLELK